MNEVPETSGTLLRSIICCRQSVVVCLCMDSSLVGVDQILAAQMSARVTLRCWPSLTRRFLGTVIVSV